MPAERIVIRALIAVAFTGLVLGLAFSMLGNTDLAAKLWTAGTLPVVVALLVSMIREFIAGRLGVDAVAFVSMSAGLLLGQQLAAVVVAVMYAGGNMLEDLAMARAERDLKSLVDRAPRTAHRFRVGQIEEVPIDRLSIGDTILVRAGEIVPVDGLVLDPKAVLDESALTGEPIPVERRKGEGARSGTLNAGNTFKLTATASAGESTYAGIVRMVMEAQESKAPFTRLADRYAILLLPLTIVVAAAAWLLSGDPIRALAVLVVATPCPLILAAPIAFIAGVSQAARRGILIKGGAPLDALAQTHTVMFDKTGTLTVGGARLVAIETAPGQPADEVLRLAASLEQASHNVVARSIVEAALAKDLRLETPTDVREIMGTGLHGRIAGRDVAVGSHFLVCGPRTPQSWAVRALRRAAWRSALSIFVALEEKPIGALLLGDELRRETPRAVQALRSAGIQRIVMVTGDRLDAAETIGAVLDLDAVLADCVPADKVDAVAAEQRLHPTVMIGDGINDAPALAKANVGIAMGAHGASAASQAADVVILVDRLDRVADAVVIAKRAHAIAIQSIIAGMGLSALAMGAAAFGWLAPVAGALIQEAIDVAVIINALRALGPGHPIGRKTLPAASMRVLLADHRHLEGALDRLRVIADALGEAEMERAAPLIAEADQIISKEIVAHERADGSAVYPRLAKIFGDAHGLEAMSRAHREIIHQSRLLTRMADGLTAKDVDRHLIRDAQRVIESLEALVRLHNAQEEDIYEHAAESSPLNT
jgi:heavy metal translocating P-type ATPase